MPPTAPGFRLSASGRRIFRWKNGNSRLPGRPNNLPPYPPLAQRILRAVLVYAAVLVAAGILLQIFTPFPVLTWLGKLTGILPS